MSVLFWTCAFGQDPVFNQTDNSRNYLNPAYIGTEKSFSTDISSRNQWPQTSGNYKTLSFQANQYLGKGNGLSIHFVNDNAANLVFKSEFGLGYAKRFTIADKHHISIGAQVSYFQRSLNWDELTFGNMIDPRRGFVYQNPDSSIYKPKVGVDLNAGVLYYNKFLFAGYTVKHLTQPNESVLGGSSKLPIRHGFQIGGKIVWNDVAFIPSFRLYQQATFNTMFATLKVKFGLFEVDAGIQFENGIFGGVGFVSDNFNIGYNYTAAINNISNNNLSTHEIRLGCDFTLFKKVNEHFFDF